MIITMPTTLAQAFRRAALPLAWYYAVTLGLPLANGAAQTGAAFVNHAIVVLVAPPMLIGLVCTIRHGLMEPCLRRKHEPQSSLDCHSADRS